MVSVEGLEYLTSALTPDRGGLSREQGSELESVIWKGNSSKLGPELLHFGQLPALFPTTGEQLLC